MELVRSLLKKNETAAVGLSVIMAIVLATCSPHFIDVYNFDSIQTSIAPSGIIALGMMILLITGSFDLSVGSMMSLGGEVAAIFMTQGFPVPVAILIGLLAGALLGLINGLVVGVAGVNPLIATIGTMFIFRGFSEVILVGEGMYAQLTNFPASFVILGTGKFLGIYYMFWLLLVLAILAHFFLNKTAGGRALYYLGGNQEAAKMLGFNVKKITMLTYVASGALSALAGILATARYEMANRYLGLGMHMSIIISCIIGGGSLAGGKGSILGAVFGVIFITLVGNSFNLFEVQPQWQNVVIGAILVIVVLSDGYLSLRKKRELGRI